MKILVVHAGRRDGYQVLKAFGEHELYFISDIYFPEGSLLNRLASMLLGSKASKRSVKNLNVKYRTTIILLLLDLFEKFFIRSKLIYQIRAYELANCAVETAADNRIDVVIFYYNSGLERYIRKRRDNARCILFQMHPAPLYLRNIYNQYLTQRPELRELMEAEEEEMKGVSYSSRLAREARYADTVICSSSFAIKSLVFDGIDPNKIHLIPYGVNFNNLSSETTNYAAVEGKIRLLFVGQFLVRKGIYEIIEAAAKMPQISIVINTRDKEYAENALNSIKLKIPLNVKIQVEKDDHKLWAKSTEFDFLILPSVAEGYGLVINEALGCGLPVIASVNSAGPDIIRTNYNGFVLTRYDASGIINSIHELLSIQKSWVSMRHNALISARKNDWTRFHQRIEELAEYNML